MSQVLECIEIPGAPGTSLHRLKTVVEKVSYCSATTGYTVLKVRPHSASRGRYAFGAVGIVGQVREGEQLILSGEWTDNEKYGPQLKITGVELPDLSGENLKDFLIGGFVKGIGPKLGEEIWHVFGERTAEVFESSSEELLQVKGIGEKKLRELQDAWADVAGKRQALIEFTRMGFHSGIIKRIFLKWPNPAYALEMVRSDPYLLAWEIAGVGFSTADHAAQLLGYEPSNPSRIAAALGFSLHLAAKGEGHTYLERNILSGRACALLGTEEYRGIMPEAIGRLVNDGRFSILQDGDCCCVYLKSLARAEAEVSKYARRLASDGWSLPHLANLIAQFEKKRGIRFHDDQKRAVQIACENQLSIITGGPGTGKTTILECVICVLGQLCDMRIALTAPTGRAAKKMSESTGRKAFTIHRLMDYNPLSGFAYDEQNPLPLDLLVVDESSMLDIQLCRSLLAAIRPGCRVLFVGDVNQLPSIGPGSVLRDIISSGVVPVAMLTKIYRQSEGSYIALNAQAILEGNFDKLNLSNKTNDFFFMGLKNPKLPAPIRQAEIQKGILNCVAALIGKGYALSDIQVLCPMNKGPLGVVELNKLMQSRFNPHGEKLYAGTDRVFLAGDKIMQTKNNYDKDVFNGDQGVILGAEDGQIVVDYDGRLIRYKPDEMSELTHAYVMTVHKAQGSEAKAVVIVLSYAHYVMLSRSIFYTAVTRARNICILIGESPALRAAVTNNKTLNRNTKLGRLLSGEVSSVFMR